MPRLGKNRGRRKAGGVAKRVKLNNENINNTETCPALVIVSTVPGYIVSTVPGYIVSTVPGYVVPTVREEVVSTVCEEVVSTMREEVVSTVCEGVVSTVSEEVVSTMREEVVSAVCEEVVSTMREEVVSTVSEGTNNVIDLTQDRECEDAPAGLSVSLKITSIDKSESVSNINVELDKEPDSSACDPVAGTSTSQSLPSTSSTHPPAVCKPKSELSKENPEEITEYECPVCLHQCIHPAKLPCSHVFCYLCVKGIARLCQPCPLCRAPIPAIYAKNPNFVALNRPSPPDRQEEEVKNVWFYKGRSGGWWQFEERMSAEIEENYASGISCFEMMICGVLYVIDLYNYVQYPKNFPTRRRQLLRELPSRVNRIGVAGIHGVQSKT